MKIERPMKLRLTSSQIIIFGFMAVILIGSLLLMLPISCSAGHGTSFFDALFTATSATCVTGLVVQDTGTYWSAFGQFVIITLIQIGGMGVITVAIMIAKVSGRKIGLAQRSILQEAISAPSVGGIIRLIGFISRTALLIELLGAVLMFPVFYREYGVLRGVWYALFHSISAFCNAGFDLNGVKGAFSSLTSYVGNPVINVVAMLLIIVGGIGFLTWEDIRTKKMHFRKYMLQSKMIILTTIVLIFVPAVFFFFFEFNAERWNMLSLGEKVLASLFQSVTPRTAGFNTIDYGQLSEPGQFLTVVLMLIGGAPGSTAGGMKVTTLVVMLLTAFSVFKREHEPHCLGRGIESDAVKHAATILMMYLVLCLTGGMVISCVEKLPILTCLFEAASALGTVGLTLGITPQLGGCARIVLILLMFIGRVGGLTMIFATMQKKQISPVRLPKERVTVG